MAVNLIHAVYTHLLNWLNARTTNIMMLEKNILVLHTFRPYLRFLMAFNVENFQNNAPQNVRFNVLKAFLILIIFVAAFATNWLNCWSCLRNGFDLDENSGQIVPILAGTQQLFTYLSILKKRREISDAVEYLQGTVENRNFF